jgi:hypothetical protein
MNSPTFSSMSDQTAQATMKQEQVDENLFVVNFQSVLTADEGEDPAQ